MDERWVNKSLSISVNLRRVKKKNTFFLAKSSTQSSTFAGESLLIVNEYKGETPQVTTPSSSETVGEIEIGASLYASGRTAKVSSVTPCSLNSCDTRCCGVGGKRFVKIDE